MIASFSYGQKDTVYLKPNDSIVSINKGLAILITKDLIKKDYLDDKVSLLEKDTANLSKQIIKYIQQLDRADKKEVAYKDIIANKDLIIRNYNDYIVKQDKKLAWSKTKTTLSQLTLLVLGIFVITKL